MRMRQMPTNASNDSGNPQQSVLQIFFGERENYFGDKAQSKKASSST